jgi:predicted AAA+ superfamily ATPase
MIPRNEEIAQLRGLLRRHRVVGIIGARQVGKTTLAREFASEWRGRLSFFDLESIEDQSRFADPMLALKSLRGLVVIDEIQRLPNLFTVLRVLADRPALPARFLVLGSASPDLLRQSSESLAGRIFYHEIGGFMPKELGAANHEKLWFRCSLPRSYLARSLPPPIKPRDFSFIGTSWF